MFDLVLLILFLPFFIFLFLALKYLIRRHYIQKYKLPSYISIRLNRYYPHLSHADRQQVEQALKNYFILCLKAHKKTVAMLSKVVDQLWYEWILFTREYHRFCQKAFGRYLHHHPAESMPKKAQDSLKRCWRLACEWENIHPKQPDRLPLLFAIDQQLQIPDGFFYAIDKKTAQKLADDHQSVYWIDSIECTDCAGESCGGGHGCSGGCGGD